MIHYIQRFLNVYDRRKFHFPLLSFWFGDGDVTYEKKMCFCFKVVKQAHRTQQRYMVMHIHERPDNNINDGETTFLSKSRAI